MTSKFSIDNRELLQRISSGEAVVGIDFGNLIVRELAAFRLAAMDSEPVAWTWHYREQWHVTNDKCRAEFVAKDGDVAVLPLYRHAQPVPVVSADLLHSAASAIEDLLTTKDRTGAGVWFDLPFKLRSAANAQPVPERDQVRIAHAEWSQATFGNVGPVGPLKHLSKEALEAAAEPGDLSEWADMQFLLWDAQRRAGITDEQITQAMIDKLAVNKQREWPEPKDGEPRLHIKGQPAPVVEREPIAWLNDAYLARGVVDGEAGSEDAGPGYIPVYREAGPQPAPVVPEEKLIPNTLSMYAVDAVAAIAEVKGWNACRAAMLAAAPQPQNAPQNIPEIIPDCWCRTCRPVVLNDMRFVVCPDCGNKRCPRANDHRNACTGSNEPGQEGSAYPAAPQEVPDGK